MDPAGGRGRLGRLRLPSAPGDQDGHAAHRGVQDLDGGLWRSRTRRRALPRPPASAAGVRGPEVTELARRPGAQDVVDHRRAAARSASATSRRSRPGTPRSSWRGWTRTPRAWARWQASGYATVASSGSAARWAYAGSSTWRSAYSFKSGGGKGVVDGGPPSRVEVGTPGEKVGPSTRDTGGARHRLLENDERRLAVRPLSSRGVSAAGRSSGRRGEPEHQTLERSPPGSFLAVFPKSP